MLLSKKLHYWKKLGLESLQVPVAYGAEMINKALEEGKRDPSD